MVRLVVARERVVENECSAAMNRGGLSRRGRKSHTFFSCQGCGGGGMGVGGYIRKCRRSLSCYLRLTSP